MLVVLLIIFNETITDNLFLFLIKVEHSVYELASLSAFVLKFFFLQQRRKAYLCKITCD